MAKIPFNIKYRPQIESGEYKLEIGKSDPWPARIVCWDLNGNDLIILVTNPDGKEEGLIYTPEGKHKAYAPRIDSDLFIVTPEEELTEFEKAFDNLAELYHSDKNPDDVACCKEYATELLDLARKELEPEVLKRLDEAYKNQDEMVYKNGKRDGKAEALKDLPRWKKIGDGNNHSSETKFAINGRYLEMNDTLNYVYEVPLSGLKKLPKEN